MIERTDATGDTAATEQVEAAAEAGKKPSPATTDRNLCSQERLALPKVFYNKQCALHRGYFQLSEKPGRLDELEDLFSSLACELHSTSPATPEMLEAAHDREYVSYVRKASRRRRLGQVGDFLTSLTSPYLQYYLRPMEETYEAAAYAAGAVCQAVEEVVTTPLNRAFCAVRPPGHHAGPSRGEGFCFFNNVAIGALHAVGLKQRVAIVDFDHHHGNGTQAVVESRGRGNILLISSHYENCKYARSLSDATNVSEVVGIPVPEGSDMAAIGALYESRAIPALRAFRPDLLMISAGFDMHVDDPLSSVRMESSDYFALTKMLADAAAELCGGKIVSVLEGGYLRPALRESVRHHLQALGE